MNELEPLLGPLARRLPKAELHLHLQGSLRPSTVHRIRHREQRHAPTTPDAIYDYRGYDKFFDDLDTVMDMLTTADLVREATLDTLSGAVDAGCRHVELMVTPDLHRRAGLQPLTVIGAVADAFAEASDIWGLTGGLLVEYHRPDGINAAGAVLDAAVKARANGAPILGIGNDGPSRDVPFSAMAASYGAARSEGFRLCGHAGPTDLNAALAIGLDRLDHALGLAADPAALREVIDKAIPVTSCITSNCIMLPDTYPTPGSHPFDRLRQQGVHVALATDDPPLFYTDLAQEYHTAAVAYGWNAVDMAGVARGSLDAAWLSIDPTDTAEANETRRRWHREIDALVADVCAPHRSNPPQQHTYQQGTEP